MTFWGLARDRSELSKVPSLSELKIDNEGEIDSEAHMLSTDDGAGETGSKASGRNMLYGSK